MKTYRFWETRKLSEMTPFQWEALCDRCARCCLYAIDSRKCGLIFYTKIACKYLDTEFCTCTVYETRELIAPNCNIVTVDNIKQLPSLPSSCAYRLLSNGEPLRWWHPLVSGDPETVHRAGISVRKRDAISEKNVRIEQFIDNITDLKII
jgi:uncharacterized cysteine cluster protein YcgN (CxxCxxCC family)